LNKQDLPTVSNFEQTTKMEGAISV